MKLEITAASGHAAWWVWTIRDDAGALVEASTTQFRSAGAAETQGRARMGELQEWRRAGAGARTWAAGRSDPSRG